MKHHLKILSAFILLLTINIAVAKGAESTSKNTQTQEQGGQELGKKGLQLDQQKLDGESQPSSTNEIEEDEEIESNIDSVQDDSVSKYNFIFYLFYKYKYEEEA